LEKKKEVVKLAPVVEESVAAEVAVVIDDAELTFPNEGDVRNIKPSTTKNEQPKHRVIRTTKQSTNEYSRDFKKSYTSERRREPTNTRPKSTFKEVSKSTDDNDGFEVVNYKRKSNKHN